MTEITYNGNCYPIQEQQSVLEVLLSHGEDVPYFCKSGLCQSCMMTVEKGPIPEISQAGLSVAQRVQSKFLPCVCFPSENISIKHCTESTIKFECLVKEKKILANGIMILILQHPSGYHFHPGQYINLINPFGLVRCYSIASLCDEKCEIELHIKHYPDGKMTNWIYSDVDVNSNVTISEPRGDCFYTDDVPHQKMLLLGVGTGLAPLLGIARSALFKNHSGDIHVIQGGLNREALYANPFLEHLASQHTNFKINTCVLHDENSLEKGQDIFPFVEKHFPNLENWKIYICGGVDFVKKIKELVFLLGAEAADIHSDTFLIAPSANG